MNDPEADAPPPSTETGHPLTLIPEHTAYGDFSGFASADLDDEEPAS